MKNVYFATSLRSSEASVVVSPQRLPILCDPGSSNLLGVGVMHRECQSMRVIMLESALMDLEESVSLSPASVLRGSFSSTHTIRALDVALQSKTTQ